MDSIEVHNERIRRAALNLPGRYEGSTDVSRGYVGWGPHEDSTCRPGRTVEHEDWQAALAAIQNPAREIHDFYFSHRVPSEECACCDGTGANKDFAELDRGFSPHGGGRWAGWGDRELYQNEIDALIENNRLENARKGEVNPQNFHEYLGPWGHDGINRRILVPIRAKNLGINCNECFECVGTGYVPIDRARIELNIWTFDPLAGTSRVDCVKSVRLDELDEIREFLKEVGWDALKRRFGWPSGDNMYPGIRYDENFRKDDRRAYGARSRHGPKYGWATPERYRSFDEFWRRWMANDVDWNLIFDYRVIASDEYREENPFADTELPEEFTLQILTTHPRKGADRVLEVQGCVREDGRAIKEWLLRSYEIHGRHFAWAVDRKFGNEVEPEEMHEEPEPEHMNFWTGM